MITASRSELTILKLLWAESPKSAREVQDAIASETGWSLSTTRTLLTRMEEKGLVARAEAHGVAVYSPASRVQVLGAMARELTRQVFDIKGALPASMFAESPHLSEEDLAELDAILNADDEENGR